MSLNRKELEKRMNAAASQLLQEKGYVAFLDVLMRMGKLSKEDYEGWRFRRVQYLEKVVTINLSKLNDLLRTFRRNSRNKGLRPSKTVYKSWGKRPKTALRFSKSGAPNVEDAYSTHFVKPKTA